MKYLHWDKKTITDFSEQTVSEMYENGYVFTRIGKGVMQQTRSVRIDLSKFELSSENRRVLKKIDGVTIKKHTLPMASYDYAIGKLAKDFYEEKFGPGIMSTQKIKEMLTDSVISNFNRLLTYSSSGMSDIPVIGYAICYENNSILHYSYPFYNLSRSPTSMGLGMMIKAIQHAKELNLKYVYLGSLQRPSDTYKLQFTGLEWFDGKEWQTDIEKVKKILASDSM